MAPRARQAKGKARVARYDTLLAEQDASATRDAAAQISIPPGPRLGDVVIAAEGLRKGYGDTLLMDNVTFSLPLDDERTAWEEISDGGKETVLVGKREVNSRAYAASFNFKGADQQKKVRDLSGGERNRVHLAKLLKRGGNVLLLDEPTNDLDVDTLRALEDALVDFAGCAVIISHDRWFLDRVATHMLAFEDEGRVIWYEGNYQEYEADRRRRLGAAAEQPHRIKYRRLTA
jgi:ATPase subunit of ABC transporter with duplicated ATPase domains